MIQQRTPLCPELAAVVAQEIARGNKVEREPVSCDWPEPGSVIAHLHSSLSVQKAELPSGVATAICNDPHYGWYNEVYCSLHRHLLTAGQARPGEPMWVKA
ncbi:hypothetical protein XpiCFBP4643_09770 [Xanthomonas pisi]|uniref:Uncharacterized protein n=1 Tax=Xanthomonas pisi TaxID=56457 RepID=A0A2S7D3C3_9XANT|nr:hypothetical protein XpiCFBP4643_09770 [Xanthomonas pisi]